ncbi:AMP-binding protein, partial [Actinotalea ferrariae]|uniref:AMP-binding enzyme n=1 Tax=Actinotalea ferrariae TaxID=1386098 RepID=UPI001C8B1734
GSAGRARSTGSASTAGSAASAATAGSAARAGSAATAGDGPLLTSLVPTQLRRAVESPEHVLEGLRMIDAVLVGGAATSPALLDRARELGLRVVTTYGMTETCGGCVYDGVPLDGVEVALDDAGRVLLGGTVVTRGYLDDPVAQEAAFPVLDGRRWHRTSDLGELDGGRLRVLGRADDVVVTGGEKVAPAAVEAVLGGLGVAEACVVGVPDAEWGQALVAVVVRGGAEVTLEDVRSAVRRTLGPAAAPQHLVLVDHLPLRGPGKVDRAAVARSAALAVAGQR